MRLNLGPAKGKDFANSFGPWMLTPDELPDDLTMTATVNGRLYSSGRLSDLYWSFGEMIAYASRGTTVVPGDVIGSGTVEVPVRIRLIVAAARLQAMANSVASPGPKRATPGS